MSLLLNYAQALGWPEMQFAGWKLACKYDWKVFANLASADLQAAALHQLRLQWICQQEIAG